MVDKSRVFKHKNIGLAGSRLPRRREMARDTGSLPDEAAIAVSNQAHFELTMLKS